jgi:hypothetical protein
MTFDEWFVKYPLPAEIDTMDDTDREQWTWALRSAYKTGAASTREWVGLTEWEVIEMKAAIKGTLDVQFIDFASAIEAKLKEKNHVN